MKDKLTSRKLWVTIAGIASGIGLIVSGAPAEGAAAIAVSVLSYVMAEGIIDAAAIKMAIDIVEDVKEGLENGDNTAKD